MSPKKRIRRISPKWLATLLLLWLLFGWGTPVYPTERYAAYVLEDPITWANDMWQINYTVTELPRTGFQRQRVFNLTIAITPLVDVYDFTLEIIREELVFGTETVYSFPAQTRSSAGGTWFIGWWRGLTQVFTYYVYVTVPETNVTFRLQGFRGPPFFDLFGWHPHKILIWGEDPTIAAFPLISVRGPV